MENPTGFEPASTVLQTASQPLGYGFLYWLGKEVSNLQTSASKADDFTHLSIPNYMAGVKGFEPSPDGFGDRYATFTPHSYIGGLRGYRTHILWFFRPALRPLKLSTPMEDREGFEPPKVLPLTVFKTAAINHTLPPILMVCHQGLEPCTPELKARYSSLMS